MRILGLWMAASLAVAGAPGAARADLSALPCTPSDALGEVAAQLLLSGERPTAETLMGAAEELGVEAASLHASTALDDEDQRRWLTGLRHRQDADLACGEAVTESRRLVVAAPDAGTLRYVDGRLLGSVAPGFHEPVLVFLGPAGKPLRVPVELGRLRAGVAWPDDVRLPARVQLLAEGPSGPRPVAELHVPGPRGSSAALEPDISPRPPRRSGVAAGAPPADRLLSLLEGFRHGLGAPSLRDNHLLERSARHHAQRVCQSGRVAHELVPGEDPVARLRRERVEARAVGEAVGRSRDAEAALRAIFDSPSHRLAVAEPRFTDVGIGHARDRRGRSCVVVLLAAWPRRVP